MNSRFYIFILSALMMALTACAAPATSSATTTVEPQVIPDSGYMRISGEGYFKVRRVTDTRPLFDQSAGAVNFEGVTFTAHVEAPGTTTTGPLAYKIDVQFADGAVEVLQYIGLGNIDYIDINLTRHENPKAGILLSWQNASGSLQEVFYLLVSE
jgi:hypothetical protein